MPSRASVSSTGGLRPAKKAGTRGMPRPERESLILEVAGPVFARAGYHAASMDEIAELAGVSKPMLYAYFGSKEGLYVAYIDRTGRELVDRLVGAARQGETPAGRMRAPIGEFLAFVEDYRIGWKVLFSEATTNRPLAEQVAGLREQIADAVCRMIENGISPRSLPPPPAPEGIAHAIVGAGESLANWWLEHPELSRREVTDLYVGIVQAAVAAAIGRTNANGSGGSVEQGFEPDHG